MNGDRASVTQHDPRAELYVQECATLRELIKLRGWPTGWPRKGTILQQDRYSCENVVVEVIRELPTHTDPWLVVDGGTGAYASTVFPAPCGETMAMLIEWLGDDLDFIKHRPNEKVAWSVYYWKNKWRTANASIDNESLILALCKAVMSAKISLDNR